MKNHELVSEIKKLDKQIRLLEMLYEDREELEVLFSKKLFDKLTEESDTLLTGLLNKAKRLTEQVNEQ